MLVLNTALTATIAVSEGCDACSEMGSSLATDIR
jgi:hypothetical protein